ncbi:L-serine ammonia-lyase [Hathewaya proteolytica DSM 3090]|uniref:L-serine dehydratase n=1 Tax=Hathewaya proteolytica DSM 3090 TaxID=1121331 RepID=A0A1M6N9Z2_9CLOT|nr:L-serine ammonia-lyase, iron-sulfur-dependent, subunit alpha [Hathewaya proteolytica]SHJ92525.1 L-serine ammonia-lyase [Hathewaya proteolytica DSM 3090]
MFVSTGKDLIDECEKKKIPIWQYAIEQEMEYEECDLDTVWDKMKKNLEVMKESASYGLTNGLKSIGGLIGGDALKLNEYNKKKISLTGDVIIMAMARAVSCSEVNATMGKVVAAPTAGSCGILPGSIITAAEKLQKGDDDMIKALFTASAIGNIIAQNASLAGAEAGCQAECGSAAAMASGAIVEMMGGTPRMALDAGSIVIKNILGLVCDPIAGLVEEPCAKRNMAGAVNALTTADMVMSGIRSIIPFDEVVKSMYKVGKALPSEFRETALGGIAITETALKLQKDILGR